MYNLLAWHFQMTHLGRGTIRRSLILRGFRTFRSPLSAARQEGAVGTDHEFQLFIRMCCRTGDA